MLFLYHCLLVGAGGAIGAIARYLLTQLPISSQLPFKTLCINIIGAIAIGCLSNLYKDNTHFLLFWTVGICGGFTTFSTFSMENMQLLHQQKYILAVTYMLLSIVGSLLGVVIGYYLATCIQKITLIN